MDPSINQIAPNLFLGNVKSSLKRQVLRDNNINSIVSLLDGGYHKWSHPEYRAIIPENCHLYVPCLDTSTMDILAVLEEICDFIDTQLSRNGVSHLDAPATEEEPNLGRSPQGTTETSCEVNVLIHCRLGISRSATVAIAYLMRKRNQGLDAAYSEVRQHREAVRPRDNFIEQLHVWEAVQYHVWEDEDKTRPKREYQGYLDRRAARLKAKGLTGNEPFGLVYN